MEPHHASPDSHARVVVACGDLMVSSRLDAPGLDVRRCRTEAAVTAARGEDPDAVWVIDLETFGGLPAALHGDTAFTGRIVAFAPHVRTDLIDAARETCDAVFPRGAVVRGFGSVVESVLAGTASSHVACSHD